jgi:hypothetical protein
VQKIEFQLKDARDSVAQLEHSAHEREMRATPADVKTIEFTSSDGRKGTTGLRNPSPR